MKDASIIALLLALAACGKGPEKAPSAASTAAPSSSAGSVRTVTIDPALVASGRVRIGTAETRAPRGESWIAAEIVAGEQSEAEVTSLASGRLATIDAALGDVVRRGQLVASVDSPEVGRASADVLRAKARSTLAARALARQLELDGQQATSKAAVDEARAEDTAARADLLAARTLLASFGGSEPSDEGAGLASTRVALRSPIDGVITARSAMLGAPVDPQKSLFHVVASASRVALARMPETLEATATPGTRVGVRPRLASSADERPCSGAVVANLGVVD
ncbi:MAG TPA: efflux RND transporter periplasmic adaptor subunit, partial [Polyangiaceae bacterium]